MEIKGKKLGYRVQQVVIFVIHILLLWWIYWLLQNTGNLTTEYVFAHFTGIGIYGALLIRGCAAWAKHHHLKEVQKNIELAEQSKTQE